MKTIKARITFTEELLGTCSANPMLHSDYIASKAPNAATMEDEVAALGIDNVEQREMTIFPRTPDGAPFLYDYQIKGFFKDACSMLSRACEKDDSGKKRLANASSKLTAFKKTIDGTVFVRPRAIPIVMNGSVGNCQRPLRAQTPKGERVALANSETVPAGSYIDIDVVILTDSHDVEAAIREWLDYGEWRGIGQWRNSGKGRFTWHETDS